MTRSLKWNGDILSTEASMTCLILACCRCDRVPALLFTRPYISQRRWNEDGEICLADPPSADMIPQWPSNTVVDATETPTHSKSGLGISPSIETLCQQDIISTEREGREVFFRMATSMREEIWEQTSTHDSLLLWFDLLRLIIYSSPDACAEIFWQDVFRSCKAVIESTLLPFLSVLRWDDLEYHQAV